MKMKSRLVRQPNGDACSAFYLNESTEPLYVRDSRVAKWRAMLESGDFLAGEGVTPETAQLVVSTFDEWVSDSISHAVMSLVNSFSALPDEKTRARLVSALDWMIDMHRHVK